MIFTYNLLSMLGNTPTHLTLDPTMFLLSSTCSRVAEAISLFLLTMPAAWAAMSTNCNEMQYKKARCPEDETF